MEATFARLIGENGELTGGFPVAQEDVQVEQYFSLIGKEHTGGKACCVGKRQ